MKNKKIKLQEDFKLTFKLNSEKSLKCKLLRVLQTNKNILKIVMQQEDI